MKNVKKFILELYRILRLPEMLILPGNLAFFLFMSLVPIINLIGLIASSFSLSTGVLVEFISSNLPSGVVDILIPFIDGSNLTTANIIFVVIGFYVASNGPDSLITASNILYKLDNDVYIFRRTKALFMTFWLVLLIVFVLVFLGFGNLILSWLLNLNVLGGFISKNYEIITILKYLIAFLFIFFLIKILYTLAPNKNIKSKYMNKGAFFSTISIMLVTAIYSFYVTNIAHYDVMYGSLANLTILVFFLYLISYILVLGIAINYNYNSKILEEKE